MKIGIVGYGKMGKMVEKLALAKGHEIAFIAKSIHDEWQPADVLIEFTSPHAFPESFQKALESGIPMVTGTTGWYDQMAVYKSKVTEGDYSFLYASNFSIGVNLFFKINEYAAKLMSVHSEYQCEVEETHHTEKKDAPSGTAITTAEGIVSNHASYNNWNDNAQSESQLNIVSHREPNVPGTHVVTYANDIDSIEIKHTANNREGFAAGAIFAAEWLVGKKGFYTMQDVLNL